MQLIPCAECGRPIADKTVMCPHCGAPLAEREEDAVTDPPLHRHVEPGAPVKPKLS